MNVYLLSALLVVVFMGYTSGVGVESSALLSLVTEDKQDLQELRKVLIRIKYININNLYNFEINFIYLNTEFLEGIQTPEDQAQRVKQCTAKVLEAKSFEAGAKLTALCTFIKVPAVTRGIFIIYIYIMLY